MKIIIQLIVFVLFSTKSYAGLIIESDLTEYSVGDVFNVAFSYEFDGTESVLDITDFDIDLTYTGAEFLGFNLASDYDSMDWIELIGHDLASQNIFGSVFYAGLTVPFDTTKTNYALFSLEFAAESPGSFDLMLNKLNFVDYNLDNFNSLNSTNNNFNVTITAVPEPSSILVFLFAMGFIVFMHNRITYRT